MTAGRGIVQSERASAPDACALSDYPMVMVPTPIAPPFITMNAIHTAVLWLQTQCDRASQTSLSNDTEGAAPLPEKPA